MSNKSTIGFIGLGVMGGPMARHLAANGHRVVGYNRTASRAEKWQVEQSKAGLDTALATTPAELAAQCDVVISCVGNDDDLAEVLLGTDGALSAMAPASLLIDHTTVSAKMARTLANEAASQSIDALDAPVSGGQAGAENGKLAIMCGGTQTAFSRAQPIMSAYGARMVHVGDAGAGQTTKMANQMCIAGVLGGLSEAIRLVQASGVDPDKVLEAISGGAAQSWQMENRWETMVAGEFDFGFAVDWMRKDLDYALEEATRLGLESPVTQMVDGFYNEIQKMGGSRQDTSSLIRRLPAGRNGPTENIKEIDQC
ncbi:NAD(P)-dependent oxidoreductase [Pontixanthobacter gangjinensis]|uniref:NAD-binding protein n=1 Tax=Pontixanthobacter gangjinensis TaxID=1028742 RepID=A0A6I4SL66_9SPHN|nr:NAD(P)-dependent oxidoreductase [Pontixanthobacter gangjinensis]MXO56404.1 NAD-binding protein [Pontixanthobacter gangjinensis]